MQPLALIYRRDGEPVGSAETAALGQVLDGLAVPPAARGLADDRPGSWRVEDHRRLTWAQWRPADPISRPSTARVFFDGRLDNGDELARALDLDGRPSDPELAAAAWDRWGDAAWDRLLGPFVAAVYEPFPRRLTLARDPLGGRSLFFSLDDHRLVASSEPSATARHPEVDDSLDERTLAAWCRLEPAPAGSTFFAAVEELPPGTVLQITPDSVRRSSLGPPRPAPLELRREDDYAEAFRELLGRAVADRLDDAGSNALLMSGGLDSTAVAALAGLGKLQALSWTFPTLPRADESPYLDAVEAALPLQVHRIPGDDAWPLGGPGAWAQDPNGPVEGPYRELRRRSYDRAAELGCGVVLTGEYGDELFAGAGAWLQDWLRASGPLPAAAHLLRHGAAARSARAPLGLRSGLSHLRRPSPPGDVLRPELRETFLGPDAARPVTLERRHALVHGLDIRRPFRDLRLLRFMSSVPAHLLFRPGWTKWLLRRSTAGLLPEPVRLRRRPSTLLPLFAKMLDAERERVHELIQDPAAAYRRFVDPRRLEPLFRQEFRQDIDGPHWVVLWRCLCLELWTRHRRQAETSPEARRGRRQLSGALG